MRIIITEDQLHLINEEYRRDRFDAEYSDEYPKYKKLFIKMLKQDVVYQEESRGKIYLMDKITILYLFIDYHPKPCIMIIQLMVRWKR